MAHIQLLTHLVRLRPPVLRLVPLYQWFEEALARHWVMRCLLALSLLLQLLLMIHLKLCLVRQSLEDRLVALLVIG